MLVVLRNRDRNCRHLVVATSPRIEARPVVELVV